MISTEVREEVADIVKHTLAERFDDRIVFDPIKVIRRIDHDGDEYLHIYIVYDGDQELLDLGWTVGLVRRIRPKLIELGVDSPPSKSFVEKSEWDEVSGHRYFESE